MTTCMGGRGGGIEGFVLYVGDTGWPGLTDGWLPFVFIDFTFLGSSNFLLNFP